MKAVEIVLITGRWVLPVVLLSAPAGTTTVPRQCEAHDSGRLKKPTLLLCLLEVSCSNVDFYGFTQYPQGTAC
jgi:hypothetical protein